MSDLKPCPFCGTAKPTGGNVRDGRSLRCPKCGVRFVEYNGPPNDTAEDRLTAAWNTRADLAKPVVKPLVWDERTSTNHVYYVSIRSHCRDYRLDQFGKDAAWYVAFKDLNIADMLPNEVAAVAYANTHHEAAVLAMLEGVGE